MWSQEQAGKIRYFERYEDYITGKKYTVSCTFEKDTAANRKAAMRVLQDKINEKQRKSQHEYTFGEIVELYRKDQLKTVAVSTYKRNYWAMERWMKIIGKDTIANRITAKFVRERLLTLDKSNGTLNGYLSRLSALIRWAYKADLIAGTECIDKLDRFKDDPHRMKIQDKYLEPKEIELLLQHMQVEQWSLIVRFMILSAMRFAEVAALNKEDVDLEKKVIRITKQYDSVNRIVTHVKTTSSYGEVFIQPELEEVIKQLNTFMNKRKLKNKLKTKLFLFDEAGDYINYYSFNKYLKENSKEACGKEITVHALRHTAASILFASGISLEQCSRRLRHSNSKITKEIYIHITEQLREKDNERLSKLTLLS